MGFPFLPEQASDFAVEFDLWFWIITALSTFFTVLVFALLVVFVVRYRKGSVASRENAHDHDTRLELSWTVPLVILGLIVFWYTAKLYAHAYSPGPPDAQEIYVVGKQWMWHLQHPNGIRENNQLHLQVGQPVKFVMISQDVIHSFYIPAFRIKKDVLPGRFNEVWVTPTKTGKFHLFCTEFCGTEHSKMGGFVYVMEPAEFEKWQQTELFGAAASATSMEAAGQALYEQLGCNTCHTGESTARCPTLEGIFGKEIELADGRKVMVDTEYVRESILDPNAKIVKGYQPIMPQYGTQLDEEKVLQLIAYIRSLSKAGDGGEKK